MTIFLILPVTALKLFVELFMLFDEIFFFKPAVMLSLHHKTSTMKTKLILITALIAVTMSGCLVKSLHPFYNDNDVVFKPELIGNWLGNDSSSWEISPA